MNKVELLPWDPTSESQYQRLYDQRVACGWHEDEISEWKDQQLKETKTLYWIVLADNLPNRAEFIAQHIATYPNSYEAKGRTRPEEVRTNEEWYLRQGYEELDGSTPLVWTNPETGEVVIVPRIFFRKYLT
ncbi:uncharacterized protein DNG_04690 [Cephalotrichum gorgonifer]|uniref:Uncharacterized protein n=1 Tax=Cephalotrichum gorgonifer TaxID=2041049 RepID=A0AAE8MWT8_9PEZI|nr:uncharacterized protein DNG_04690 [Cephalotrichum gorgonifer]